MDGKRSSSVIDERYFFLFSLVAKIQQNVRELVLKWKSSFWGVHSRVFCGIGPRTLGIDYLTSVVERRVSQSCEQ